MTTYLFVHVSVRKGTSPDSPLASANADGLADLEGVHPHELEAAVQDALVNLRARLAGEHLGERVARRLEVLDA